MDYAFVGVIAASAVAILGFVFRLRHPLSILIQLRYRRLDCSLDVRLHGKEESPEQLSLPRE